MNFIFFDRTMCTANIDTLFFRYCLARQPSLIKYVLSRWVFGFLHIFGLVRDERYYNRRWRFLKSVRGALGRAERFWQRRRPKVYDIFPGENNLWITRWPEAVMLPLASRYGAVLIAPFFDLVDGRFAHFEDTAALYKRALKNYRPKLAADAPRELVPTGLETVHVFRGHAYKTAGRCRAAQFTYGLFTFIVLLALGAFLGLVGLYLGTFSFSETIFPEILARPGTALLNIWPAILLIFLLYFIFNRVWFSFTLTALATLLLSLANWFKLAARSDPFMPSDLRAAGDLFGLLPRSFSEVGTEVWICVGLCLIAGILAALLVRSRIVSSKLRFCGLFAVVCLIIFSYFTLYTNDGIYASAAEPTAPGEETLAYVSRGCQYPFLHAANSSPVSEPEGYDKYDTLSAFSRYVTEDIPSEDKVSVVFVMLESFSDLSELNCLDMTIDVYRPLHMLQKDSVRGSLVSDVFAEETAITEREVLTGNPDGPPYRSDASSYARYFNRQGYATEYYADSPARLYNRANVAEYLGFSESVFNEDGGSGSDAGFFAGIRSRFEAHAAAGTPYFGFSVGRVAAPPRDGRTFIAPGTMTEEQLDAINGYLGGVETTVREVADLADWFDEREEPVVLVVFGDRLPDLGEEVYAAMGANVSPEKADGFLKRYGVPYVIHANSAAKHALNVDFAGDSDTISPCFLVSELFGHTGWGGTAYMKVAGELTESVTVIHPTGRFMEGGEITSELSEEASGKLAFFRNVSFLRRWDFADYR